MGGCFFSERNESIESFSCQSYSNLLSDSLNLLVERHLKHVMSTAVKHLNKNSTNEIVCKLEGCYELGQRPRVC